MTNDQLGPSLAMSVDPVAAAALARRRAMRSGLACMGGWCRERSACAVHRRVTETTPRESIVERLKECPR